MNEVVKDMVKAQLEANPRSKPGDLAYLLEQYEALKHKLDHRNMTGPLVLHTTDDECMVAISQEALSNAFDNAFSEALRPEGLLDVEMRALLDLGEDFAVVFCGGSFMSSVFRRRVEERLHDWNSIAGKIGVVIRHCFLSNVDTAATTAVACGAALSAMRVPPLAKVMEGAAVGIQTLVKVKDQAVLAVDNVVQWDEEEYADFFFGEVSTNRDSSLRRGLIAKQGCGTTAYINYTITSSVRSRLRFRLVCDPEYHKNGRLGHREGHSAGSKTIRRSGEKERSNITKLQPATGTTQNFQRIRIEQPGLNLRNRTVYDMDFEVDASELPTGLVRFRVRSVGRLTTPGRLRGETSLWIEIRCCKVGHSHRDTEHLLNKRWQVELQTDIASKLAVIGERRLIPIRCIRCGMDIISRAYLCQICTNFGTCANCGDLFQRSHKEATGHAVKAVDVHDD